MLEGISSHVSEEQLNYGATGQAVKIGFLLLLFETVLVCSTSWRQGDESSVAQVLVSPTKLSPFADPHNAR